MPPAEQAVTERLSRHVLKNWQRFVEGIHEVATIEQDLQVATLTMWCVSAAFVWALWRNMGSSHQPISREGLESRASELLLLQSAVPCTDSSIRSVRLTPRYRVYDLRLLIYHKTLDPYLVLLIPSA